MSQDNHTLLIKLDDRVQTVAKTLEGFVEAQGLENRAIHRRIDETAERGTKAVEAIKDSLNARGRISGNFVLSLIAVLLSSLAIIGGAVTTYVSNRLETLEPQIHASKTTHETTIARLQEAERQLQEHRIQAAAADASAATDRQWTQRELDFIRDQSHTKPTPTP